ncbi:DUF3971 domain-containing protein, partial [Candidatus Pseudothioglobus singularis]|nr:DUF3971 domain-containing protein [Candidatus Pseudothioglobus singularis]
MLKKTLLRSLNILKISTWVAALMALAVLAVVAFLIMFPQTIKGQIESRLSEISGLDVRIEKISLEFQENELFLAVKELQISSDGMKPIAKVDVLRWNVNLMALYKGIEIPGHIDVNELIIDTSNIDDYVAIMNAEAVLSNIGLSGVLALQSLSINRTQLTGQQSLDLAPIELKRNKQKISLSMRDQSIFSTSQVPKLGSMVNINTSIDVAKAREERVAMIPFSLQNEDFNLSAQVKIFNQQDQVYLEFESYIDQIEVSKINQNIPDSLSSSEGARWIDEVLKDGFLTDIMLTTRFNMSGEIEVPSTKFSANLLNATMNANPNWPSIKDINAKVTFSNDYLKIVGNQASVEDIDLSYLSITTRDFNQPDAKLSLNARFDSNSQKVEQFIRETSVSDKIKAYLDEFELSGKLWGNINLVAPLQKNTDQKPELTFDMFASENSLSLFDGEINVDGFNSQISFKDGLIRTKGKGLIGGELFQMSLNPKDWINEDNSALKVKLTHLSSSIDAYISKRSANEWNSIMKSKDLYADMSLLIDNNGKYFLNLRDLNISSLDNINDWKLSPKIFPSLHLSLKDSKVNNKKIPNFEADLINHDFVMEIKNLVFENIGLSEEDLIFNGSWLNGRTALRAKASSKNLSSFLNKFGVNESVIGGGFSVDLRLYCDCEPWQVAPKNVTGYMQADVAEGVFTSQDPNLFKLISFINLETIANRFRLTRSEIREAGYVYDQINAKLLFNDGVAKVDYFLVESEESDIELTGSVD